MFSNKGKDRDSVPAAPAPSAPPTGKRPLRTAAAPSIISADLCVTGTLASSGDIQIDGRVEGDVRSAGLVIGEKAFIQGDIMAEEVTVRGQVQGSIKAHKVLLASTCHVEGNILHEAFAVETGAFFEGNCRHADNPLADETDGKKPAATPQPPADKPTTTTAATPTPPASPSSPASPPHGGGTPVAPRPPVVGTSAGATYTPLKS